MNPIQTKKEKMKTIKSEMNRAKKQTSSGYAKVKKQIAASAKKIGDSPIDYNKLTKTALKIAIPIVALKLIHSQYKKSHANKIEAAWENLYNEVKAKFKNI